MAKLNMNGPYPFNEQNIENQITRAGAGNYALGRINHENSFVVEYVGRSDTNLKSRLKSQLLEFQLSHFKFSYANTALDAFNKECQNYHDFGGNKSLKNEIHPDKPTGASYKCPVCGM